tara:strand:+ start:602 stop:2032 length:1431 start_codon:yes stop_codon:yes gene_type:complete
MLPKLTIREKEICHITLEDVMCRELDEQASDDYISVLKTTTNINVVMNTEGSYIIDCGSDALNDVLSDLKHLGFKIAVLWAEGSWPTDTDIDTEILKSVKEWNGTNLDHQWNSNQWGCAGHILDRPGQQNPQFHHQCVIINLQKLENSIQCRIPLYEASAEHLHDDYTPTWIKPVAFDERHYVPKSGWADRESKHSSNLFNCFLRTSLEEGLKVFNLDYNIRSNKVCIYPEDDIEWTEGQIFKEYDDYNIIYDIEDNYSDKRPLLEFKTMSTASIYVTNTEMVPWVYVNDLQIAVCPCSGLHQFKYIEPSLDVMEKVIWADYSTYAVKWVEILIQEWNGKDFHKFFESNKDRLQFDGQFVFGHGTWEKFLDSFESEEQWLTVWSKIQNLEHQFEVANLVTNYDKIVEMIPHNKNVLLQCSNIFLYESNYFTKGFDTTIGAIDYIKKVQSISNKVIFNGDLNGHYYDMTNMGRQKWV